eukprot:TRINITY_DN11330_c0_g1_i1.p1 TRINITY_DN11330_c0_g1~~TRINITY_DN11330_c0_g1_i1.p1  ORF type:complete len:204 (+),score=23.11 TRINITY_DN11330_c0_g1_i1:434-1045(+)
MITAARSSWIRGVRGAAEEDHRRAHAQCRREHPPTAVPSPAMLSRGRELCCQKAVERRAQRRRHQCRRQRQSSVASCAVRKQSSVARSAVDGSAVASGSRASRAVLSESSRASRAAPSAAVPSTAAVERASCAVKTLESRAALSVVSRKQSSVARSAVHCSKIALAAVELNFFERCERCLLPRPVLRHSRPGCCHPLAHDEVF